MTKVSVRSLGAAFRGPSASVSVARDILGFWNARVPPSYPPQQHVRVSLRGFIDALHGMRCFDINIIVLGVDRFADADDAVVDFALLRTRDIYGRAGICVRRIGWFGVPISEAAGLDQVTEIDQCEEITHRWSAPGRAIDVFVPFRMRLAPSEGDVLGQSPAPAGGCDKSSKKMNGVVVCLYSAEIMPVVLAHELGHYLGLSHVSDTDWRNVMCPTVQALPEMAMFYPLQASWMMRHCMMNDPLQDEDGLDP